MALLGKSALLAIFFLIANTNAECENENTMDNIWQEGATGQFNTVWKFQNFSITQILREINFRDFRSAKSAILPLLETLNFDLYAFWPFLKVEKTAIFAFLEALNFVFW